MRRLNLPTYSFKIKSDDGIDQIFDEIRRKYVKLTPEEWVRQNFLNFLIIEKKYPKGRLIVEHSFKYNGQLMRSDIAYINKFSEPYLIVECKAPQVKIDQKLFDQIVVYNMNYKAKFIVVTNGLEHFSCVLNTDGSYSFLKEIPEYNNI